MQKGWMFMSIQSELKAFKEITSWDECKHPVLNHTYILNNLKNTKSLVSL